MGMRLGESATLGVAILCVPLFCFIDVRPSGADEPVSRDGGQRLVINVKDTTMAFRWCPPGEMAMGSTEESGPFYGDFFVPQHPVQISRGFWIGETEVTQHQYESVTGNNPSFWQGSIGSDDPVFRRKHTRENPVERVSWGDAARFCEALSAFTPAHSFRLPTETEWEYACRGGAVDCRYGAVNEIAWVFENTDAGNGSLGHMPVGRKKPNAWGLHDMLGNVSEWCSDWRGPPPTRMMIDPVGPSEGRFRVFRGGNCFADVGELRTEGCCLAGTRRGAEPDARDRTRGFRVVLIE